MTKEVKRYVTTCDCMSDAAWGDYVRHEDYAALEQECERLRVDNVALARNLKGSASTTGATYEHLVKQRDAALADCERLREAIIFACKSLAQVTSSDGSGHADIATGALRMAGFEVDQVKRMVEEWKSTCYWRIDAALQAKP